MFVRPARLFSLLQAALFGVWVDALDANAVTYVPSYLTSVVSKNQSEIYLLRGAGSSSDLSLQSLDLTQSFNTSDIGFETVSSELPFIARQGEPTRTPLPLSHATTSNGTLIVLTGSYHNASAELWAFSRTGTTSTSDHTSWVRVASNSHIVPGLAVHSALIAFAPEETDLLDQELYTYGGMYPQGNADAIYMPIPVYSGNMTSVLISNSSAQHLDLNNMAAAGNRPQAGFSVTPLSPLSSSNGTSHPAYDQTYVLMGGHSANEVGQVYFTNMSKLLLFSLPEETWIPIDVETDTTQLLSKANVGIVEPRSGHSAVLTPDGSKIIVIGGFRVNSTIAAQPQVAVLEVGAGFGGAGAWRWRAPKGPFEGVLDDGSGIFGHGAALLLAARISLIML
ncbi:hypothetical protein KEM52_002326 [Ascosphaera acerosa]|nr:hypothetical protein KEM52_002326 [Ascosphaera acerosa]